MSITGKRHRRTYEPCDVTRVWFLIRQAGDREWSDCRGGSVEFRSLRRTDLHRGAYLARRYRFVAVALQRRNSIHRAIVAEWRDGRRLQRAAPSLARALRALHGTYLQRADRPAFERTPNTHA